MEYISQKGMDHLREMIAMTTLKFAKGVVVRNIVQMATNMSSIGLNIPPTPYWRKMSSMG
jgi:hypothetical protein